MTINCKVNNVRNWTVESKNVDLVSADPKIQFSTNLTVLKADALFVDIVPDAKIKITIAKG